MNIYYCDEQKKTFCLMNIYYCDERKKTLRLLPKA